KDGRHDGIVSVLLKLYTSANGLYAMRVKAGREPRTIDQPSLSVLGTAIPQHFYEGLSAAMLTNGFFARLLILEAGRRQAGQDVPLRPLPDAIVEAARWWAREAQQHQHGAAGLRIEPRVVGATPEAKRVLGELRAEADREYSEAEERDDVAA